MNLVLWLSLVIIWVHLVILVLLSDTHCLQKKNVFLHIRVLDLGIQFFEPSPINICLHQQPTPILLPTGATRTTKDTVSYLLITATLSHDQPLPRYTSNHLPECLSQPWNCTSAMQGQDADSRGMLESYAARMHAHPTAGPALHRNPRSHVQAVRMRSSTQGDCHRQERQKSATSTQMTGKRYGLGRFHVAATINP